MQPLLKALHCGVADAAAVFGGVCCACSAQSVDGAVAVAILVTAVVAVVFFWFAAVVATGWIWFTTASILVSVDIAHFVHIALCAHYCGARCRCKCCSCC